MSLNWKTNEPFHVGPAKSGPKPTIQSTWGKQSVTVKLYAGVRWQHFLNSSKVETSADSGLQCHSNPEQRADRQKIQMNALLLPGLERSWWRGVLSGSCWLLATWDCSGVEGHWVCCVDRIELLMASLCYKPRCFVFCHCATWTQLLFRLLPSHLSLSHLNQLFRFDIYRSISTGVQ